MRISVAEAVHRLEGRGVLSVFRRPYPDRVIPYVEELIGRALPEDLADFYRAGIAGVDYCDAIVPVWNDHVGWRTPDSLVTEFLPLSVIPLFGDGCGNKFCLDLTPGVGTPAIYFFEYQVGVSGPKWAAGSSLGAFMLLAADNDRAFDERWPERWELTIDPDLDKCPRAPPIWAAG